MPNSRPNNEKKNPSTLRSMMGFLSNKGKFGTGTKETTTQAPVSIPSPSPAAPIKPTFSAPPASQQKAKQDVSAQTRPDPVDPAVSPQADPLKDATNQTHQANRDLQITARAALSLTSLFAGLAIQPGSGDEIPPEQRQAVIHNLIDSSHQLANRICLAVMGDNEESPPDFLRAMVLGEVTKFVGKQWSNHQKIDIDALAEPIEWSVKNQIPSMTQETLDLIDVGKTYNPASSEQVSQIRITNSIYSAQLKFLSDVELFYADDYDKSLSGRRPPSVEPFTYGKSVAQVTTDLLQCVLRISNQNKMKSSSRDANTTYHQNSIARAQMLVSAQYRKITDAMLTVAFDNELESASAIEYANSLYDEAIEQIEKRAHSNFILIEKMALDVMGVENNPNYSQSSSETKAHQSNQTPTAHSAPATSQLAATPVKTPIAALATAPTTAPAVNAVASPAITPVIAKRPIIAPATTPATAPLPVRIVSIAKKPAPAIQSPPVADLEAQPITERRNISSPRG